MYDKRDEVDFDIVNFPLLDLMAMSLGEPLMECIYFNLFVSLKHLLTLEIKALS